MVRELIRDRQALIDRRVESIFKISNELSDDDYDLLPVLAGSVVLLASGHFEKSMREIFAGFFENNGNPDVANFAEKEIKNLNTLGWEKFMGFVERFQNDWVQQIVERCDPASIEAVTALKNHRNRIAHGEEHAVSLVQARQYLERSKPVIEVTRYVVLGGG